MFTFSKYYRWCVDLIVTLLVWIYYLGSYFFFFLPLLFFVSLFSANREYTFQRISHLVHRSFFLFIRRVVPRLDIRIQDEIRSLRSSVIVCNHLSLLDPILIISLFERHKTIVKGVFFKVPVISWMVKNSGYLPSTKDEGYHGLMIERVQGMKDYLSSGGNLFVFPEGTRSRDGKLGPFHKGAFRIAKLCRAPIHVLIIKNTNKLFQPGRPLFHTSGKTLIEIEKIGTFTPEYESASFSTSNLIQQVRTLYDENLPSDT
jgi:1-acyl-sn-glycerol-3-phosphate acyltransferase